MIRWSIGATEDGAELDVHLDGEITENVSFEELTRKKRERVVLDLDGVRRINSHGVRRFVDFVREQTEDGEVVAERCRPAIVHQLGMVPELGDRISVRSLYVPYECPKCLEEAEFLVELSHPRQRPPLPARRCRCGATMDVAEPLERYFAFQRRA